MCLVEFQEAISRVAEKVFMHLQDFEERINDYSNDQKMKTAPLYYKLE